MLINRFPLDAQIDRFFRLAQNGEASARRIAVPVDVREESDRFVLAADLPGFTREDIKLSFEDGVLVLAGARQQPVADKTTVTAHRLERAWGSFERRFTLPTEIDAAKIDASFQNGVLTVVLPKKTETKPRAIEIR